IAEALIDLLAELHPTEIIDPIRHRVHDPLHIVTSENATA
ncbi:LacI family transcriptional regulator, partial [Pseudomonas syringae pv. tagetis]